MKSEAIEKLFKLEEGCTLFGWDGSKYIEVMRGSFRLVLTQYYMTVPWKAFYIQLPDGGHYPKDYVR